MKILSTLVAFSMLAFTPMEALQIEGLNEIIKSRQERFVQAIHTYFAKLKIDPNKCTFTAVRRNMFEGMPYTAANGETRTISRESLAKLFTYRVEGAGKPFFIIVNNHGIIYGRFMVK